MNVTLVVMAAGMGSRFGGLKQAEPITDDGRCIIDFSVFDAIKAGFNKVVFVIRRDIEADFKRLVGYRIERKICVEYVFQNTEMLPKGRTKPFGTGHAVLCCKDVVNGPFAIINADDYYGANAFTNMYRHLVNAKKGQYAMIAYRLGNTLSPNGAVSRGVCEIQNGYLSKIVETSRINFNCVSETNGERFDENTPVSMNMWGLTNDIFPYLETKFSEFLEKADIKCDEFSVPNVIFSIVQEKKAQVKAIECCDKWYGITYRADIKEVKRALNKLVEQGEY